MEAEVVEEEGEGAGGAEGCVEDGGGCEGVEGAGGGGVMVVEKTRLLCRFEKEERAGAAGSGSVNMQASGTAWETDPRWGIVRQASPARATTVVGRRMETVEVTDCT